jgi:hypothetical protein
MESGAWRDSSKFHTFERDWLTSRGGRRRFFRAFALASVKSKKRAKKVKAPSVKEKSANSPFFLPLTLETRFQSPNPLGMGESKGLE